jgi:hypothetical protein
MEKKICEGCGHVRLVNRVGLCKGCQKLNDAALAKGK